MLVGIWESNTATGSSIILRKSDRTFLEKKIQKYDYSKPPISYSTQGEWKVNGNYYIFTAKYFSIPLWQNAIDKPKKVEVTEITPIVFKRLSTDGANIEERKVGKASETEFTKMAPKPLPDGDPHNINIPVN